ncbi:MAG: BamA/TamA family outer membrane protein, partial [Myxococcales bacterium]|nr:BamA/TamA family outer membrane protein [Myxococcales bacterium]
MSLALGASRVAAQQVDAASETVASETVHGSPDEGASDAEPEDPGTRASAESDTETAGAVDSDAGHAAGEPAFEPFDWSLVPLPVATSDLGVGGAALANLVWFDGEHTPFRQRLLVAATLTHELFQTYALVFERVGLGASKVRLRANLVFAANPANHYCGVGNDAECNRRLAESAVLDLGLNPGEMGYDRTVDRYFRQRSVSLSGGLGVRIPLARQGHWLDVSWRGERSWSGFFGEPGPYPLSAYAQDQPEGEEGFASELGFGWFLDRRDAEVRTTSGFVVGAYLRGATRAIGSEWSYLGGTAFVAGYQPLDARRRWVWASRLVADVVGGDTTTRELSRFGGLWTGNGFGGSAYGRGIRANRFLGGVKVVTQSELRGTLHELESGLAFGAQAFVDLGLVGESIDAWGGDGLGPRLGFG